MGSNLKKSNEYHEYREFEFLACKIEEKQTKNESMVADNMAAVAEFLGQPPGVRTCLSVY